MAAATDRGIIYLFCGIGFAERMIVSLWTVRQHWTGPVTVFVTDDDCEAILKKAPELQLDLRRVDAAKVRRHSAYLTKTLLPTWTPYERSVFLDGDTIVVGSVEPLFESPLAISHFAGWVSQGSRMAKRINSWRGLSPAIDALVEDQLAESYPAINTGVFGFHREFPYLGQWHAITQAGAGKHMTDELAMQLLQSAMPADAYRVFDDRYNCSPLYGQHRDDVRVWHFHGNKHVRNAAGLALWGPAFESARAANVGGLADWAGKYDRTVAAYLKGQHATAT